MFKRARNPTFVEVQVLVLAMLHEPSSIMHLRTLPQSFRYSYVIFLDKGLRLPTTLPSLSTGLNTLVTTN
jgi:hypothetical protein